MRCSVRRTKCAVRRTLTFKSSDEMKIIGDLATTTLTPNYGRKPSRRHSTARKWPLHLPGTPVFPKITQKYRENGPYGPKTAIFRPFFRFFGLSGPILRKIGEKFGFEQGVPGYGPQVIAWRWPPLATIAILTAGGPSPEP